MQKYIEKMKREAAELDSRIKKATAAVENPPFGMDAEGLRLLKLQICAMESYFNILHQRIRHEETK